MRKVFIAAIVASALFAVGAFAATFTVQSEDVASGSNAVTACATNVEITFNEPAYDSTTGKWMVTNATATFYNVTGGERTNATGCADFDADLAIDLSDGTNNTYSDTFDYDNTAETGTPVTVATAVDGVTTANFTISLDVATIIGASVAVDNVFLAAPL